MRKTIFILSVSSLSSCASLPDTSDALMGSTQIKETYCYAGDYQHVSEKVRGFLEQCYYVHTVIVPIAGIPMPMTSEYQVIEEDGANYKRYSVRSKYGFGISVNIKPGINNCKTQVDMYALRSHLREKFNRIDAAINGNNPGCGII